MCKGPWHVVSFVFWLQCQHTWSSTRLLGKLAYRTRAKPSSKVGALFARLCAATSRAIEGMWLAFGGKHLSNKTTLARAGVQGNA